jgi:isopentenyl diphosphate isomerase/L-lactate dehydrogenase-like FMN-dependent dehydrogenase
MKVDSATNISDSRRMASRGRPEIVFDLVESGAENALGLACNLAEFRFIPHCVADCSKRDRK